MIIINTSGWTRLRLRLCCWSAPQKKKKGEGKSQYGKGITIHPSAFNLSDARGRKVHPSDDRVFVFPKGCQTESRRKVR